MHHLGHLRDLQRPQREAKQHCLPARNCHARHPVLRPRHQLCGDWRDNTCRAVVHHAAEAQRTAAGFVAHKEHFTALHAHAHDRLFIIRRDCDTLIGQPPDGPELARRHIHAWRIPRTRAVWRPSAVLRARLHIASGPRARRQLLPPGDEDRRPCIPAEGESLEGRERLILRGAHQGLVRIRPEHAVPKDVQRRPRRCLRELDGWCRRHQRALRPLRRRDHGQSAHTNGEHTLLPVLPMQLHVLALLHVELRRKAERPAGQRRTGAWQLDYRLLVV